MSVRLKTTLRLLVVLWVSTVSSPGQGARELRGLWVDAWGAGFLNASQTTQLVADCRKYNFNAIFVQMRRRGDAFYMPQSPNGDPRTTAIGASYDALADLINKAHSGTPRIEVHCWVTANLIWSATTAPPQASHVVNLHPEFLMKDYSGATFLAEGKYLDPGHPGAMQWNHDMALDIVRRYNIDGFHWDYIRYPQQDSGYNDTAIADYKKEFNLTAKPLPSDARFSAWRRRKVTEFLRWTNADLLALKPNLVISAAVFADRNDAFNYRFQDWSSWNSEGIIDICIPMNYSANNSGVFIPRANDAAARQGVRRVYMGQGSYLNTVENTVTQLNYARSKGLLGTLFYSYRTPNSGTVNQTATFDYLKANYQPTWLPAPDLPWKTAPSKGIAKGLITSAETGLPLYNATVIFQAGTIRSQKSETHGAFAFFEMPTGTYTITASYPGLQPATNQVTIEAGKVVQSDFALGPVPPAEGPIGISGIERVSENLVRLELEVNPGIQYDLLRGTELGSWSVVTNFTASSASMTMTDPAPPVTRAYYMLKRTP